MNRLYELCYDSRPLQCCLFLTKEKRSRVHDIDSSGYGNLFINFSSGRHDTTVIHISCVRGDINVSAYEHKTRKKNDSESEETILSTKPLHCYPPATSFLVLPGQCHLSLCQNLSSDLQHTQDQDQICANRINIQETNMSKSVYTLRRLREDYKGDKIFIYVPW